MSHFRVNFTSDPDNVVVKLEIEKVLLKPLGQLVNSCIGKNTTHEWLQNSQLLSSS